MGWIDVVVKAISDFGGDLWTRWVDITVTATPFSEGASVILLAAAGFFILMLWVDDDWITRRRGGK